MFSIWKRKADGILAELGPKAINPGALPVLEKTELLVKTALVSSLEPICCLEIRNLDRLTEKNEMEEIIKRQCREATNT